MNPVLSYLWDGFLLTLQELALLLGPGLVFGLVLHYIAEIIRLSFLRLMGVNAFAWLTAPGTVIHELSHAFFCLIFRHEIRDLALFRPSDKKSLGHVKHAYNPWNPYHMLGHFFIGSGPIWFGAAVLYGLSILLLGHALRMEAVQVDFSLAGFTDNLGRIGLSGARAFGGLFDASLFKQWETYVFLYLGVSIGAHMTLSMEDLGGALKGAAVILVLALLANWGTGWNGWASDGMRGAAAWLMRPLFLAYGVMVFAILLVAAAALPVVILGAVAGDRREEPT